MFRGEPPGFSGGAIGVSMLAEIGTSLAEIAERCGSGVTEEHYHSVGLRVR
jgi:hypothetical protein